jgi:hypothetical protein
VRQRFADEDVGRLDDTVLPEDTAAAVIDAYRAGSEHVDALIADADLDDLCANVGDRPMVSLRWIVAHLLEETARHAGHADILREQIDGATGR